MRWSRCMSLLPRTTLHSDSEQEVVCMIIVAKRSLRSMFLMILRYWDFGGIRKIWTQFWIGLKDIFNKYCIFPIIHITVTMKALSATTYIKKFFLTTRYNFRRHSCCFSHNSTYSVWVTAHSSFCLPLLQFCWLLTTVRVPTLYWFYVNFYFFLKTCDSTRLQFYFFIHHSEIFLWSVWKKKLTGKY